MEDHKGHLKDEFLEALYKAGENGRLPSDEDSLGLTNPMNHEDIESLLDDGFIVRENSKFDLTSTGKISAESLVRNHRLAERLFSEILDLKGKELNTTSCSFEHVLDTSVIESMCTILGHPPTCPHGKRIPPGKCCKASRRQVKPIVTPLTELPVAQNAKIVFITTPHHQRLGRLINLGVIPGGYLTVVQKYPSYLLKLGETEIAIDSAIASEIFVRATSNEVLST